MRSERFFGSATMATLRDLCFAFLNWILRLSGSSTMRSMRWQRSLVPVPTSDTAWRRGGIERTSQLPYGTDNHKGPAMP
jgi:hypothetical protein